MLRGAAPRALGDRLRRSDDRRGDARDLVLAQAGGGEQLLGSRLRALEDRGGLRARPLERLLDLGAGGVRELGRLVARLLEQPGAARLGLVQGSRRVAVRVRKQLARLALRGVQDLVALALALLAEALDLPLLLLQLALAARDLDLGAAELRGGRGLRVPLECVGELGGRTDEMQRVHPHRVTRGIDAGRLPGRLQHAELRLQLQRVAAEGVERLADAVGLERALLGLRQVLQARKRGERGLLR